MRDEVLRPLDDPREVAHAELAAFAQRKGDRQPGRIAKRAEAAGERARLPLRATGSTKGLGLRNVEAKQVAASDAAMETS
jgi:hypothetical protein